MTRSFTFRTLATLILLTAIAAWVFRDDIFQTLQDPGQPFQTYRKPPAPDYAYPSSWMALPDLHIDPATLEAKGDIFIVTPEVYKGSESWNLPIDSPRRIEKLQRIVRPNYVEPYRPAGRLFAPYYRQAALYAFLNNREDSLRAQDLAYQDVRRAFSHFLSTSPPERPIVIVGHGQGAAHAQRLLKTGLDAATRKRLAAAYIIDHPLPLDSLALPQCQSATDTGCVVAWTKVFPSERTRPERLRNRTLVWMDGKYTTVGGRPLACTNPLSWTVDTRLHPEDLHKGGVSAIGFEPGIRPTVHPNQVSAQCRDGLLHVSKPAIRSLRRPRRIGGKFRTLPSNLFYEDLRQNAVARVDALIAQDILPKRAPVMESLKVDEVDDAPIVVVD